MLVYYPGIEETVNFLKRPDSYPQPTRRVETRETHMSWVFLTDTQAWKLKKRVRFDHADFRTLEARRNNCQEEVRLNRRLAPGVYWGVAPLSVAAGDMLRLGASGTPVDWLVRMRRLPSDRMLDHLIATGAWSGEDIRNVGIALAAFYQRAAPLRMTGADYRALLCEELLSSRRELTDPEHAVREDLVESAVGEGLGFLARRQDLLDERAAAGKIIEAHGDLRPEHICLEERPVIIDCLEFNRNLRILDPASELTFLALECERLGGAEAGKAILETYRDQTGDRPPAALMTFYRTYHACIRAKVAIWHLRDPHVRDVRKWISRAQEYLRIAS